jgi:hypothetical protein
MAQQAKFPDEPGVEIRLNLGMGAYAQGDLKTIQQLQEGPFASVGLKVTNNFPAYYSGGAELRFLLKHGSLGFLTQLEATGYRSAYADYSGSLEFTQQLSATTLGGVGSIDLFKKKKIGLALESQANVVFSRVDISSELRLTSAPVQQEGYGFKSTSVLLRPALDFSFSPHPKIVLHATGGYAIDFRGELKSKSNTNDTLLLSSKTAAKTDWTGWRVGISFGVRI